MVLWSYGSCWPDMGGDCRWGAEMSSPRFSLKRPNMSRFLSRCPRPDPTFAWFIPILEKSRPLGFFLIPIPIPSRPDPTQFCRDLIPLRAPGPWLLLTLSVQWVPVLPVTPHWVPAILSFLSKIKLKAARNFLHVQFLPHNRQAAILTISSLTL